MAFGIIQSEDFVHRPMFEIEIKAQRFWDRNGSHPQAKE